MSTTEEFDRAMEEHSRGAYAAGLRTQAGTLRALAEVQRALAEVQLAQATALEAMAYVPEAEPEEPEEGGAAPEPEERVEAINVDRSREAGELLPFGAGGFSPAMADWLEMFDDRIRRAPYFAEAVNEAADAGRAADETTARMVAARVRELSEAAAAAGMTRR